MLPRTDLIDTRQRNNQEIFHANEILRGMTSQERAHLRFPERFHLYDDYNAPTQIQPRMQGSRLPIQRAQRAPNDIALLNQVLEHGLVLEQRRKEEIEKKNREDEDRKFREEEEERVKKEEERMKKEEKILKKKEYLENTPRLDLIDRNHDPIYAKDTIDGIIKDSLIEIQTSCSNNEDDNFYPEKKACNLEHFLKKLKDKLKRIFNELKTNMTPEHLLEFERYKNRFRSRQKKLDPSTPLSLFENADRIIRNSKPSDLGKSREEVNEIMEYINLPPFYLENYDIVHKINLLKKIYKVWYDINQIITPIQDPVGEISYQLYNSIIYMIKKENNKYTIICSCTETEFERTVADNLDADFSNLLIDRFFFNIFAFANNLNDKMNDEIYRDERFGGKRKTKKSKRKTNKKKSMKKRKMKKTKKSKK